VALGLIPADWSGVASGGPGERAGDPDGAGLALAPAALLGPRRSRSRQHGPKPEEGENDEEGEDAHADRRPICDAVHAGASLGNERGVGTWPTPRCVRVAPARNAGAGSAS
jgi:hypothetical protein